MRIKSKQAASLFFPSTSLEFVYYEAVANSIDAGANEISIKINIDSYNNPNTLKIIIEDNGEGFNSRNFEKFNNVLDVEDNQHKGIGRLVFLKYFKNISITSYFENKVRKFIFDDEFDGNHILNETNIDKNLTTLIFSEYRKEKIKAYGYLVPSSIKKSILEHFIPKFYKMKMENQKLIIEIELNTNEEKLDFDFSSNKTYLDINELPELKEKKIKDTKTFFSYFKLLYSIEKNIYEQSVISAICADGRTIPMEIISNKDFPTGYKMVFILYSDYFDGKTDTTREKFVLDDISLKHIKKMFTKLVSEVIKKEIPDVIKHNEEVQNKIQNEYPHLVGYFDDDSIGILNKENIINDAQDKFFKAQKEILEADHLSDEQYEKSLDFSARILTEYVLYRSKIIEKLKKMDTNNNEADIHDLIVPRKKKYIENEQFTDFYTNNAWVLDDKYMTYSKVLSDIEIDKIFIEIDVKGNQKYGKNEKGRPDITIVFSDNPDENKKIDVVIVELKKLGLGLDEKEKVISQLKQRARRLLEFYPNKIQRIWFYGIVDFDPEFRASLIENEFTQLFSKGDLFYKNQDIIVNPEDINDKKIADLFILSYDSMLNDAESRNLTFLRLLKEGIKESIIKNKKGN